MSKKSKSHEKPAETNDPIAPVEHEPFDPPEPAESEPVPVPPSLDVGVPTDPNDVPKEEPEEAVYTVKLTASQIKALQDVLSGVARVPGVTGATPVHDNDAGALSAIGTAVSEQDDLQDSDTL